MYMRFQNQFKRVTDEISSNVIQNRRVSFRLRSVTGFFLQVS